MLPTYGNYIIQKNAPYLQKHSEQNLHFPGSYELQQKQQTLMRLTGRRLRQPGTVFTQSQCTIGQRLYLFPRGWKLFFSWIFPFHATNENIWSHGGELFSKCLLQSKLLPTGTPILFGLFPNVLQLSYGVDQKVSNNLQKYFPSVIPYQWKFSFHLPKYNFPFYYYKLKT